MGKREVHVITVRKPATAVLLLLVSAAMVALLYYLSGKAYAQDAQPAAVLVASLLGWSGRSFSRSEVLALAMPMIGNALLFMPWGFLMFLALDSPRRPRSRSYLLTLLTGVLFAGGMEIWQLFLPTRVTGPLDVVANAIGVFGGAMGGHLRKLVRLKFEV